MRPIEYMTFGHMSFGSGASTRGKLFAQWSYHNGVPGVAGVG